MLQGSVTLIVVFVSKPKRAQPLCNIAMLNIHIYCYNEVEGRELVSVSDSLKKWMSKKYKISLTNLLSLVISTLAIGTMVTMVNLESAYVVLAIDIIVIVLGLEPYIRKV